MELEPSDTSSNASSDEKKEEHDNRDYFEVNVLHKGAAFGEGALLKKGARRNAAIVALTDCYFATLGREHYQKILFKIKQDKLNKQYAFIKSQSFI